MRHGMNCCFLDVDHWWLMLAGLSPPAYCLKWRGVTCDASNNIVRLNLSNLSTRRLSKSAIRPKQIQGVTSISKLVPHLTNLTKLQVLVLDDSPYAIGGSSIPASLNRLKQLRVLSLARSGLSGQLPSALGTMVNLQELRVNGNPLLQGSLPELFAGLVNLKVLDVSSCGLSGPFPEDYGSLQELQVLRATGNKPGFSGRLPDYLGILGSLVELDLSSAQFSGSLPAAWADWSQLQSVAAAALARAEAAVAQSAQDAEQAVAADASHGGQDGDPHKVAVATARQAALASLQERFTSAGSIKAGASASSASAESSLGMSNLQVLNVSNNKLAGAIPAEYSRLRALLVLDLSRNALAGNLPVQLAVLSQLQVSREQHTAVQPGVRGLACALPVPVSLNLLDL